MNDNLPKDSTQPNSSAKTSEDRANLLKSRSNSTHTVEIKPLPLQRELSPPKPFPFEALGPILGPAAKRLHEVVKAPDSVCGQSILAAASLITQPYADVHIDGRRHPLSLFMLTVAESGDRKSAVDNIALKAVRDYEKMLKKTSENNKQIYKNKLDVWKKQREKIMREDCEPECLENELNNLPEPKRPLEPHLLLEEPTYEGLVKLYAVGQPSVGLFSDEGGRMFGGHGMGKDNELKTACGLSSLWDGKPITRIRGGDENLLLYGKRLAAHLMIQDVVLKKILQNDLLSGQGMIARFLIAAPLTNSGNRLYNSTDLSKDPAIVNYQRHSSAILDRPFPFENNSEEAELTPCLITLNPMAKERWVLFHNEIDGALKPDGIYCAIRRATNKAAEQVLRIAGVLTMFDNVEAKNISVDAIERAIQLVRFYLNEALRIADAVYADPKLELAQSVLNWMKKQAEGELKTFSLQTIYQRCSSRAVRNAKTAREIMGILEEHGQIKRTDTQKQEWRLAELTTTVC